MDAELFPASQADQRMDLMVFGFCSSGFRPSRPFKDSAWMGELLIAGFRPDRTFKDGRKKRPKAEVGFRPGRPFKECTTLSIA